VGFGDRSTGRGTFGANLGRAVVTSEEFSAYVHAIAPRRDLLPKLLWANLLLIEFAIKAEKMSVKVKLCTYKNVSDWT